MYIDNCNIYWKIALAEKSYWLKNCMDSLLGVSTGWEDSQSWSTPSWFRQYLLLNLLHLFEEGVTELCLLLSLTYPPASLIPSLLVLSEVLYWPWFIVFYFIWSLGFELFSLACNCISFPFIPARLCSVFVRLCASCF